jgi:5-methylcytosine-specific restriction protein A
MPSLPKRVCGGCGEIISGDCPKCKKRHRKEYDRNRQSSSKRGYNVAWRRVRRAKLSKSPLCECVDCEAGKKRVVPASTVHHLKPIDTHPHLRLKMSNLLSMARECHEKLHKRFVQ